jgi:hypothetical protein
MRQAAIIFPTILVLLVAGTWISPRFLGAEDQAPKSPPNITPAAVPDVLPTQFKVIKGAEGFWRLAQTADGVWWFFSPENRPEFLNTVTTVQPYQHARDKDGPSFVSRDYDGGLAPNGNLDAWATRTLARLRDAGFKGVGAWSHPVLHKHDVPMARDLNVWTWMHGPTRRFYHPDFAMVADQAIKSQVEPLKDNRNLIGYFIDNELDWGDEASGPAVYFDHLPANDTNRLEVVKVIQSVWATVDQFNHDWPNKLKEWEDLAKWNTLPRLGNAQAAYSRLFSAWLSHLAEDYFRLTTQLVHKYDKNHLILGVRFKGHAIKEVCRASRGYTDVQSINYYPSDARLDPEMFRMMHDESGQPVMLSEFSFHSLDGRSGNRNTIGFGAQVLDQQARGEGYRLFTTRLARVPWIVGADWFQWNDEPPSGRINDGEDANFGMVDIDDQPYDALIEAVRQTAPLLNGVHTRSNKDDGREIWRESFAEKPVHRVPFLNHPMRINGELSDWPREARIPGIRHSQTVGLERSKIPLPNVYLGWTHEGLYLAAEVFDNDIQGAPAQGWWWTRDNFEFWISTRPVAGDQNSFNQFSHQFFFVPNNFPQEDGLAGVIGQWKRDGDAIKENLIPHPAVKEVCRIFPNRYVVEAFIPKSALNGFDPKTQPALAFNIHIRNYQHALDYFWSAPKDILTQMRPNTWGPIYLEQPGAKVIAQGIRKPAPATQPTASAAD